MVAIEVTMSGDHARRPRRGRRRLPRRRQHNRPHPARLVGYAVIGQILEISHFFSCCTADLQTNKDGNKLYNNNMKIAKLKDLASHVSQIRILYSYTRLLQVHLHFLFLRPRLRPLPEARAAQEAQERPR